VVYRLVHHISHHLRLLHHLITTTAAIMAIMAVVIMDRVNHQSEVIHNND
jgi:hypothetical protein